MKTLSKKQQLASGKIHAVILSILFFVASFLNVQAQPAHQNKQARKEKIESMKIGFITQKLDLTPKEAQDFWPVYNAYEKQLQTLRENHHKEVAKARKTGIDQMTDAQVEKLVDDEIIFRQQELDIVKAYHAKFKTVLPIKKVAKLYAAQEQFKVYLLNQLRKRRKGGAGTPPPPPRRH